MVKVRINSENNILLFKRMNKFIIDEYKTTGIKPSIHKHKRMFEAEHGVKIEMDGGFWRHMEFPSEEAYTMALLKWL